MGDTSDEFLKFHLQTLGRSVEKLETNVGRIFDRQDDLNVSIQKLILTVEQYNLRTVKLEDAHGVINEALQVHSEKFVSVLNDIRKVERDIEPIKNHVESLNRTFFILQGLPIWGKILLSTTLAVTSVLGVYFTYLQTLNLLVK